MTKTLLRVLAAIMAILVCAGLALVVWLRPAPGEWSQSVRTGPIHWSFSMRKLVLLASRPRIARLAANRYVHTSTGTWHLEVRPDGALLVICRPCRFKVRALGATPLFATSTQLTLWRLQPDQYAGVVQIRHRDHQIPLHWEATMHTRGATANIIADSLPVADMVAMFGQDMADIRNATISGNYSFNLQLTMPRKSLDMQLRFEGFRVAGLGTDRLLDIQLPENCASAPQRAVTGWLPIAVIAAEDQAFRVHAGYDPTEIAASLRRNDQEDGHLRGASTLTQQLARLLYAGAERTPQRKLRELLYAVEMERTLGKARILQLYLALAPWGNDLCGAESAAQRYLGKSASRVSPVEAAWLAGLLVNPDAQLRRQSVRNGIDLPRTTRILNDMRPMAAWRRQRALTDMASFRPLINEGT